MSLGVTDNQAGRLEGSVNVDKFYETRSAFLVPLMAFLRGAWHLWGSEHP